MTTMLDRITVEAFLTPPTAAGFWLDSDTLGTGRLSNDGPTWTPITDDVRDISIKRGAAPTKLTTSAEVGTASIALVDADLARLHPATPIRITGDGHRLFTGHVLDIHDTEHHAARKSDRYRVTTVSAVDRVSDIANTMRYGAYRTPDLETPWDTFETAADRYSRYLNPTGWEWNGPRTHYALWHDMGGFSIGLNQGAITTQAPTPSRPAILTYELFSDPYGALWWEASRTFHGLPPNTPMSVTAWARSTGAAPTDTVNSTPLPRDGSWIRLTTTSTTTSAGSLSVAFVPQGRSEDSVIQICGVTVNTGCPSNEVQNIVYESSLSNHLDLTANSSRGAWWVDAHNVIQVRTCQHPTTSTARPHFTDGSATAAPDALSYVALEFSYDTAGIVNDLSFANHGRIWDEESRSYVADDHTIRAGTSPTSITTYGPRRETLDTALPITPPTLDTLTQLPDLLAREYLKDTAVPVRAPRFMKIYHDPDLPAMPDLDIRDTFDITHSQQAFTATITGISHSITREKWHTDYTILAHEKDT